MCVTYQNDPAPAHATDTEPPCPPSLFSQPSWLWLDLSLILAAEMKIVFQSHSCLLPFCNCFGFAFCSCCYSCACCACVCVLLCSLICSCSACRCYCAADKCPSPAHAEQDILQRLRVTLPGYPFQSALDCSIKRSISCGLCKHNIQCCSG